MPPPTRTVRVAVEDGSCALSHVDYFAISHALMVIVQHRTKTICQKTAFRRMQ